MHYSNCINNILAIAIPIGAKSGKEITHFTFNKVQSQTLITV